MFFQFWGDGSQASMDLVDSIRVRSTENFNWTFIFILAVVFYIYWSEIHKKNTEAVCAGLALYGVHWLYEICNAIIGHVSGYPLWSVSNESTTFILLIGVCWELSMMFSIAVRAVRVLPRGHEQPLLHLGLQVVGRAAGVHHDVHPVFPREQLCAGHGAEEAPELPHRALGAGRAAADRPDPAGHHLNL